MSKKKVLWKKITENKINYLKKGTNQVHNFPIYLITFPTFTRWINYYAKKFQ